MKVFRIDWVKIDSGGGSENIIANDILECLQSFYDAWGDIGTRRFVINIQEIQLSQANNIKNVVKYD